MKFRPLGHRVLDHGRGPRSSKRVDVVPVHEFPEGVEVLDVGTPGLDFTPYIADTRMVIVLDTVKGSEPAGTLRLLRDGEIVAKPPMKLPKQMIVSPRELFKLIKAGKVARLVDSRPPFRFVAGTIPGAINIPFPKMAKMIGRLPKKKDALIVFFCQGKR